MSNSYLWPKMFHFWSTNEDCYVNCTQIEHYVMAFKCQTYMKVSLYNDHKYKTVSARSGRPNI